MAGELQTRAAMPPSECTLCGYRGTDFRRREDGEYVCPSCGEATGPVKRPAADAASKITAAGITLAAVGGLTLLLGLGWMAWSAFLMPPPIVPPDMPPEQHAGYVVGYRLSQFAPPIVALLLGGLQLAGGFSMTSRWSRGLGIAGAIAAVVPCTCTMFASIPVGIWVLIVLNDPAAKAQFR
jgi:hypothetical protein